MRALLVLVASLGLLAGCVGTPSGPLPETAAAPPLSARVPPVPEYDFSKVVVGDHAHSVPALHSEGHGLSLVGHTGLGKMLPPTVGGSVTQIDVAGDHVLLSGFGGGLGFALVDVSDPANPEPVSWWGAHGAPNTARFSDDGSFVFFGCQPGLDPRVLLLRTCRGDVEPMPGTAKSEIVVVDVRDKTSPQLVTSVESQGTHNLYAVAINGTDHVFSESGEIFRFDREAGALELVAQVPGRHDQTVARHPVTGDWLLFNGHGQLSIFNVNDPANPQVVHEGDNDREKWVGWHDQVLVPGLVDGRVLLVVAGESLLSTGSGTRVGVFVVDVTDPAKPERLARWDPPFEWATPYANYRFSPHEMAATPYGQVVVSFYHGGAWVIDLSTKERQEAPVTLAAFQPDKVPDVTPGYTAASVMPFETPYVWGAAWDARGYLLVPDAHTGLYVLEPEWGLWEGVDSGM